MSGIVFQRKSIRDSFSRSAHELEQEFDKEEPDCNLLKMLWRRTEDRFVNLEKLDNAICNILVSQDVSQIEMDEEVNGVQTFRDQCSDINCRMDRIMRPENNIVRSIDEPKSYKLPKWKLVEYDGNPRGWLDFWSQFKPIHENEGLSYEVKFKYLKLATVVDSDARRVVSSFPPTSANYEKAINHLKSRFGKDKVLIEVYVRDLLKLVLSNIHGQQKIQLATLYDQLETQLRSLESLGVTTGKYAAMLYPMVESALSEDILQAWERTQNQKVDSGDVDQLEQLMQFLRRKVVRANDKTSKYIV